MPAHYTPDYACIGFPKCATTFILKRFSEYSFNTLVEGEFQINRLPYFSQHIIDAHEQGQKVGIKNPTIIYSKDHTGLLLRNGSKIIVAIRNPVRWIKSFYNYRLQRIDSGKEPLTTKEHAIIPFNEIAHHNIDFRGVSINRGMMGSIIQRNVLDNPHYDRSNVHYVIQEEFEADHERVLSELLEFLEIPPSVRKKNKRYKFQYEKPNRWASFNDDSYDDHLYDVFKSDMAHLENIIENETGKDLSGIWNEFYGRDL